MKMRINNRQKVILLIYALVIFFISIYVPWQFYSERGIYSEGYQLIWEAPDMAKIDLEQICVEFVATTIIFFMLFLVFRPYNN